MTEIMRAGIQSVNIGQREAAMAIGMKQSADYASHSSYLRPCAWLFHQLATNLSPC